MFAYVISLECLSLVYGVPQLILPPVGGVQTAEGAPGKARPVRLGRSVIAH